VVRGMLDYSLCWVVISDGPWHGLLIRATSRNSIVRSRSQEMLAADG
jgi:hypothetical protein